MAVLALGLLLVLLVGGCIGSPDPPAPTDPPGPAMPAEAWRQRALLRAIEATPDGGSILMTELLGSDWDHVAVLGPGVTNASARILTGAPFDVEGLSPYANQDGGVVFVLVSRGRVRSWFPIEEGQVGSVCLNGLSFPAAEARFWIHRVESGPPVLWIDAEQCGPVAPLE